MTFDEEIQFIMNELETQSTERTKKYYQSQGVQEPLFGTPTGKMKVIAKQFKKRQDLAESLYNTNNFDAMYFAGVIADPDQMTKEDFYRWARKADNYMVSDFIVAVTLSESPLALSIANEMLNAEEELLQSAGWSCYEWLIGSKKDTFFDPREIEDLLHRITQTIHTQPERVKIAMNRLLIALGLSYIPLHEVVLQAIEQIGPVSVLRSGKIHTLTDAKAIIQREVDRGRLGFKRKYVRC